MRTRRAATSLMAVAVAFASASCATGSPMSSIRLEGNAAFTEAELRESAKDCADVDECVSFIEDFYYEDGYVAVQLVEKQSRLERWFGSRGRTLSIAEGPQFRVGTLTFAETGGPYSDDLGNPAHLEALGRVRTGDVFRRSDLAALIRAIYDRYQMAGYSSALVVPVTDVSLGDSRVALRFEIERGPRSAPPAR